MAFALTPGPSPEASGEGDLGGLVRRLTGTPCPYCGRGVRGEGRESRRINFTR
jgi:hypothetical protein